jgi:CYTH domain-containing protein
MQEIERRFWLDQLPKKKYSDEQEIVQGYYTDQKNTNSRIRKCKTTKSTTYTQTIKHGK